MNIAVLIQYCSNDRRFIEHCMFAAQQISKDIVVSYCDHFFDGTSENEKDIELLKKNWPTIRFIKFKWGNGKNPKYWHGRSRQIAFEQIPSNLDYVLFLDSDEIIDFNRFKKMEGISFDAALLGAYWYFRKPIYRALKLETAGLLIRPQLDLETIINDHERKGIWNKFNSNKKIKFLLSPDKKPLIHHFSWVRTKQEMLKKTSTWGHKKCRNWKKLIEQEFLHEFEGTDFVHGYKFEEVSPFIEIEMS